MRKKCLGMCVVLAALLGLQATASAAIVLTPVVASNTGGVVNVNLFATYDGVASNQVAAYGFTVTIGGGPVSSISPTPATFTGNLTNWGGVGNVAVPGVAPASLPLASVAGQVITFTGATITPPFPALIPNVSVATTTDAQTLIGKFSFTAVDGTYSITTAAAPLPTYVGSGFVNVSSNTPGGQTQLANVFNSTNISIITAVPEPSSLILIGMAGVAWRIRRRALKK